MVWKKILIVISLGLVVLFILLNIGINFRMAQIEDNIKKRAPSFIIKKNLELESGYGLVKFNEVDIGGLKISIPKSYTNVSKVHGILEYNYSFYKIVMMAKNHKTYKPERSILYIYESPKAILDGWSVNIGRPFWKNISNMNKQKKYINDLETCDFVAFQRGQYGIYIIFKKEQYVMIQIFSSDKLSEWFIFIDLQPDLPRKEADPPQKYTPDQINTFNNVVRAAIESITPASAEL